MCRIKVQTLAWWLECLPMTQETWVQFQVESYHRLKKWYLITPCLTLSIIRYRSRVKWSNPEKGVAPSPTPWCSGYWKGSLWVSLDYGHNIFLRLKNQMPWRNLQTRVLPQGFFFAFTPLWIGQIMRIWESMDRFLQKPFWFFFRTFSTSGWIQLEIRAL